MSEQFAIYLWSISESIREVIITLNIISIILFALAGIFYLVFKGEEFSNRRFGEDDKDYLYAKNVSLIIQSKFYLIVVVVVFSGLLTALIPSKQDIAIIWAYPYIKAGVTSEKVQAIPNKVLDLANGYLDKEIGKIKNEHTELTTDTKSN